MPPINPHFWEITRRIARQFQPRVAQEFTRAIERLQSQIDLTELASTLSGLSPLDIVKGDGIARVQSVVLVTRVGSILSGSGLGDVLLGAMTLTGRTGADVLSDVTGIRVSFNERDVNTVMAARTQTAELIVSVSDRAKETVRIITTAGADLGITVDQQARLIREVVGLPPNWARAPLNMEGELRAGDLSVLRRRWSAVDRAKIKSRVVKGTVDDAFVLEMRERYSQSLVNRRALNIARTETLRATNLGQRVGWRQASAQGVLPPTARRFWIVTPDDRLRDTHAAVPDMNPEGVPLDGVFLTPFGPSDGPPLEPLCRCAEGLQFPGQPGGL